ncbi:unnamed protein product [Rotaria socialis]|uniref:UBC core domain-containing protein n=1 Tax=Rotaria socialis TaxID=392032 RepID=A0A818A214_9BILA|nr:unnamed protein product [Rotaria socialis]CAF4362219.1 unnamed protein product [Rotaria socialis]
MAASSSSNKQHLLIEYTPKEIEPNVQNLNDVEFIYLHSNHSETQENNVDSIGQISMVLQKMEHQVKEFSDIEQCLDYIRERPNSKFYLNVTNDLDEDKMSTLKEYSQIRSIFQFTVSSRRTQPEDKLADYQLSTPLITEMSSSCHKLMDSSILSDIEFTAVEKLPSHDFIIDSRFLIQYRITIEILLRIPITPESKTDFTDWCRENYSTNSKDIEAIELFDSKFKVGQAILWYTKQSFVSRILNRTFANDDIRLIFKIRYFIFHLYSELKTLYERFFEILNTQITVYRGKQMPADEFQTLEASINKLVITKCFLSTSLNREVALLFSGREEVPTGYVAVIFRMIIDKTINRIKPFAFIRLESAMADEDEFLLGIGIIFRIQDIIQITENTFEIVLVYTSEQEKIEEEMIRSKTSYLEQAQHIQSIDDFDCVISDVINSLNEPKIASLSAIQDDGRNNLSIESSSGPKPQQQTIQLENKRHAEIRPSFATYSLVNVKRLWLDVNRLRSFNYGSPESRIFILDSSPFDEDEESDLPVQCHIIGRIFPSSHIYNKVAYQIRIDVPQCYPFEPPSVYILAPIYHPNVCRNGKISLTILENRGNWLYTFNLVDVIHWTVDLIDNPCSDFVVNPEAGVLYDHNRDEFNRVASLCAKRHALPRV